MSDLNQMIENMKAGNAVDKWRLDKLLKLYDNSDGFGPICCNYTDELRNVIEKHRGHNLKEVGSSGLDDYVIGCSRGYMNKAEHEKGGGVYLDELCKGCVQEARALIRIKGLVVR